jgi:hypothetical protein
MDSKEFNRIKRRVIKTYPKAETRINNDGLFFVGTGTEESVVSEYMIPPQTTVSNAWLLVSETMKVHQNIERTNPKRMDNISFEKKFNRISNRNKKR